MRRETACIFICFAVSLIAISAAMFQGLNGSHVWRQADVYSQLSGILDHNHLSGLVNFFGDPTFYDVPIYQHIVATLSRPFTDDVLAFSRLFNAVLWLGFLFTGVTLAERLQTGAGKYYALLLATSQILIHYFSTPLPDLLAATLCMVALLILLNTQSGATARAGAIALFLIATTIKSPVAFVFFIFFATLSLARLIRDRALLPSTIPLTCLLPPVAIAAELMRKSFLDGGEGGTAFARPPEWYFGDLAQRMSANFWATFAERNLITAYLSPSVGLFVTIAAIALAIYGRIWRSQIASVVVACLVACLSGWLVFSNLYFHHDYYYIPGVILLLLAVSLIFAQGEATAFATRTAPRVDYAIALAAIIALPVLVFQTPLRDMSRVSQFEVLGYLIKDQQKVLLIHDAYVAHNPSFGGHVERPFKQVTSGEFAQSTATLTSEFDAIILHSSSQASIADIPGYASQNIGAFQLWTPAAP